MTNINDNITYNSLKSEKAEQVIELGQTFKNTREFLGLSYYDLEGEGLFHAISKKIEEGKNFTMNSMFKYLNVLGHHGLGILGLFDELELFAEDVSDMQKLGAALKKYRKLKSKTLNDMLLSCGLRNNQVLALESGKSCNAKTLQSYLSEFPDLYFNILMSN